ncbi:YceI family protein [soil metagenome]
MKYLLAYTLFFFPIAGKAQLSVLTPSDGESSVGFKIKNFGIETDGIFTNVKGSITFTPDNISASSFMVSVDASSINTNNNIRDKHLRKADYFDVQTYPLIKITSTKVTPSTRPGTYFLFAKLSLKNTVKEISFPFTATSQKSGVLFSGIFKINRRDYGIGGHSITLADDLVVVLSVFAK